MKLRFILIGCFSLILIHAEAQRERPQSAKKNKGRKESKQEKRAIKDTLREYYQNPEKFVDLKNDYHKSKKANDSLHAVSEEMQAEIARLKKAEQEAERLKKEKIELEERLKDTPPPTKTKIGVKECLSSTGVHFTVQIGAYQSGDIETLSGQTREEVILMEGDAGGLSKYLIGCFDEYENAALLKKKIKKLGIRDAWVVAYKDGNHVPMQSVRDIPVSE